MNKTVKNSLIVMAIVIVLFGITWLIYDMVKQQPADTKVNANLTDGNTGLDNIINDLFENMIENKLPENTIDEEKKKNIISENEPLKEENENNIGNKDAVSSGSTTDSVTSREEKAIELVKKEWGDTEGVYFSNESIDSKGRYIISVRSKGTVALAFYVVDVDKQLVTEQ